MKIIIKMQDDIDPALATKLVGDVIKNGRISKGGKQYCYATVFPHTPKENPNGIVIYAEITKNGTDVFSVGLA